MDAATLANPPILSRCRIPMPCESISALNALMRGPARMAMRAMPTAPQARLAASCLRREVSRWASLESATAAKGPATARARATALQSWG